MQNGTSSIHRTLAVIASAALAATGAFAQDQAAGQQSVPDAQVESNVLRALAGAQELSTQNIQSTTVYGVVTLTGNVHDEQLRVKAENLAARAPGVKKVVDELTLGDTPAPHAPAADQYRPEGIDENGNVQQQPQGDQQMQSQTAGNGCVLQSDGTCAGQQAEPGPPMEAQGQPNQPAQPNGYPAQPNGIPAQPNGYPSQPGYSQAPPPDRRPMYQNYGQPGPNGPQSGQMGGQPVTVPAGAPIQIRINRGIDWQHIQPGTPFDGVVMQDVVSNGFVAIPRGATVQGVVVDAKKAKALSGHGELALQLTGITLGGNNYPMQTQVWQREGKDKTAGTVNSALGVGVLGAIIGGVAGGGAGAAVGGAVGAGVGVAGSAGSPRGQIIIPPESLLTFTTAEPVGLTTVSQAELSRLAYAAGPQPQRVVRPRRVYYPYGPYGPGYYTAPPPPPAPYQ